HTTPGVCACSAINTTNRYLSEARVLFWCAEGNHAGASGRTGFRGQESSSRRSSAASEGVRIPLCSRTFRSFLAKCIFVFGALCETAVEVMAGKGGSAGEEVPSNHDTTMSICGGVSCSKSTPIPEPTWQDVTSA